MAYKILENRLVGALHKENNRKKMMKTIVTSGFKRKVKEIKEKLDSI